MSEEEQNKEVQDIKISKLEQMLPSAKIVHIVGKVGLGLMGLYGVLSKQLDFTANAFACYVALDFVYRPNKLRQEKSSSEVKYENKPEDDKTYS